MDAFPTAYLVTGRPDNGKTSFSLALAKLSESYFISGCPPVENPHTIVVMLDRTFNLYRESIGQPDMAITDAIHLHKILEDKTQFMKSLFDEIEQLLAYKPKEIVLEGYALNFVIEEVTKYLESRAIIACITIRSYHVFYYYRGHCHQFVPDQCVSENSYTETVVESYRAAIFRLRKIIVMENTDNILRKYKLLPI